MKDPKIIAQQLRKPSGKNAGTIAKQMRVVNWPLYQLVIRTMEIRDNESILEIGFGGGEHFKALLSQAKDIQIHGIDYSEEMVEMASATYPDYIESGQLVLINGNSKNLPFDDNSFDKVFCNMVVYFWNNPGNHLKEIYRVLKPEGKFYTGMRPRHSMLQLPFTKFGFNLLTEDEYNKILEENRFSVTGSTHQTDPVITNDEELKLKSKKEKTQLESVCIISIKKP